MYTYFYNFDYWNKMDCVKNNIYNRVSYSYPRHELWLNKKYSNRKKFIRQKIHYIYEVKNYPYFFKKIK